MEKLTYEEHCARAMLMGFTYVPQFGYYRKIEKGPGTMVITRLDALSLEPIPQSEAKLRQRQYPMREKWYD